MVHEPRRNPAAGPHVLAIGEVAQRGPASQDVSFDRDPLQASSSLSESLAQPAGAEANDNAPSAREGNADYKDYPSSISDSYSSEGLDDALAHATARERRIAKRQRRQLKKQSDRGYHIGEEQHNIGAHLM